MKSDERHRHVTWMSDAVPAQALMADFFAFASVCACLCFGTRIVCVLEPRGASEGPGTACAPFPFVAESTDRKRAIDLWISYRCRSLCLCRVPFRSHVNSAARPGPCRARRRTLDSASCAASLSLCVTSSPSSSGTYDVRHYVKSPKYTAEKT